MTDGPLAGICVLDISETVGGAYCTRLLAGLGAEVTLVEPPAGHPLRRSGPFPYGGTDPELSAAHLYYNAGKRSVTADVTTAEGCRRVLALAAGADVLVESLSERRAAELGISPDLLRAANPALQVVSVTPWGRSGPNADRPGSELTLEALAGVAVIHGEPPREPLLLPGWQMECFAGTFAAVGAVAALFGGGPGQVIEVSALEAAVNALETRLAGWSYTGRHTSRALESADRFYPVNVWPCKDGYLALAFYHTRDWEGLTLVLGDEKLMEHERFGSNSRRLRNRSALDEHLGGLLMQWTVSEVFTGAVTLRSAVGMVLDTKSILADPHLRERGALAQVEHPVAGHYTMPGAPFRMGEAAWRSHRAPTLGEHNGEVRETQSRQVVSGTADGFRLLEGVRVIELSTAWAGPTCGRVLGGLGADVIKVESCTWWDAWRGTATATGAGFGVYADNDPGDRPYERTPLFGAANRNKRGLILDLSRPEGKALFLRLVEQTDVVFSNFSARVLPNLGFGYDDLRRVKDDIIVLRMPAYGATGPYRDGVCYGSTIEAMGGMSYRFGYAEGPPQITHDMTLGDPFAGVHAALAVVSALHHRSRTDRGMEIDLSQQETMLAQQGEVIVACSLDGSVAGRTGSKAHGHAPHGYYPCAGDDAWIAISAPSAEAWSVLHEALGDPKALADARFATNDARLAAQTDLDAALSRETARHDKRTLAAKLVAAGVDAAPVLAFAEMRDDPQVVARQAMEWVEHPQAGRRLLPRLPFTVDGRPLRTVSHTPLFGQDNEAILGGLLGLGAAEIERLRLEGIIGDRPVGQAATP